MAESNAQASASEALSLLLIESMLHVRGADRLLTFRAGEVVSFTHHILMLRRRVESLLLLPGAHLDAR